MFQVGIHHFLQSADSTIVEWYMQFISLFGYQWMVLLLLIIIMYGIDFRKGFILLQVAAWSSFIIGFSKDYFALPRPFDVDATLKPFGASYTLETGRLMNRGATGFFTPLPSDVLKILREGGLSDFGFPSGHVTIAVSLFGSLVFLFRKRWIQFLSLLIILSMPFSRMYLARHFLADVLGGLLLGMSILLLTWIIALNEKRQFLRQQSFIDASRLTISFRFLFLIITPLMMLIFTDLYPGLFAYMLGINLVFILVTIRGYPMNCTGPAKRILRVVVIMILFSGFYYLSTLIPLDTSVEWKMTVRDVLVTFIPFLAGTYLCKRFHLFALPASSNQQVVNDGRAV